jgi:hypothetical protein
VEWRFPSAFVVDAEDRRAPEGPKFQTCMDAA